jgi:signal peptidase complex subunit 3
MTEFGAGKKKNDLGFLNFDLTADLEPLFNWNVKQLFLYLTAEYETKEHVNNCVVYSLKNFLHFKIFLFEANNSETRYRNKKKFGTVGSL